MNALTKHIQYLPDERLRALVIELKTYQETGILAHGAVRALAQELQTTFNILHSVAQTLAETVPLQVAAYRWAEAA